MNQSQQERDGNTDDVEKQNAFQILTILYAVSLAEHPAAQRAEVEAAIVCYYGVTMECVRPDSRCDG